LSFRNRIAVVHWLPLEQFPPVENLLKELGRGDDVTVRCFTTRNDRGLPDLDTGGIKTLRWTFPSKGMNRWSRLLLLVGFQLWVSLRLVVFRPSTVLYYEPHSAGAVFLYVMLFGRVRLFVHNHEYREQSHFKDPGNRLFALFHRLEKRFLYRRAEMISHTNQDRVRMFLEDLPSIDPAKMRAIPNFPAHDWLSDLEPRQGDGPIRMIYVGAASFQDTFIREFVEWFGSQPPDSVTLTLMVNNTHPETREWLLGLREQNISVNVNGVPYSELPRVLREHDIGVILYRGTTRNYIYNAPNKLFEYLICGLDVWFPQVMVGIRSYADKPERPRVRAVDFAAPEDLNLALSHFTEQADWRPWTGTCRDSLRPLLDAMRGPELNRSGQCVDEKSESES
jgi:hypothetical protein